MRSNIFGSRLFTNVQREHFKSQNNRLELIIIANHSIKKFDNLKFSFESDDVVENFGRQDAERRAVASRRISRRGGVRT